MFTFTLRSIIVLLSALVSTIPISIPVPIIILPLIFPFIVIQLWLRSHPRAPKVEYDGLHRGDEDSEQLEVHGEIKSGLNWSDSWFCFRGEDCKTCWYWEVPMEHGLSFIYEWEISTVDNVICAEGIRLS